MQVLTSVHRHFATSEIKTYTVALLVLASVEVDRPNGAEPSWPKPTVEKIGTGVFNPKSDVNVIVRRRLHVSS